MYPQHAAYVLQPKPKTVTSQLMASSEEHSTSWYLCKENPNPELQTRTGRITHCVELAPPTDALAEGADELAPSGVGSCFERADEGAGMNREQVCKPSGVELGVKHSWMSAVWRGQLCEGSCWREWATSFVLSCAHFRVCDAACMTSI
eukprot:1102243-Pelagomonas_calceolata.AAC.2